MPSVLKRGAGCFVLLSLAAATPVAAMREPARVYTTADGLPADTVNALATDARGQILIGGDGVFSFFDGASFRTAGADDGVPPGPIRAILNTRSGTIWIGTTGAVARLKRDQARRFTTRTLGAGDDVLALVEDPAGRVWAGTSDGLRRIDDPDGEARLSGPLVGLVAEVNHLALDGAGHLWAATSRGLARINLDGEPAPELFTKGLPEPYLTSVLVDRSGRVWAGTRTRGLCRLPADLERTDGGICERLFTSRDGLASDWIRALHESAEGSLDVGTGAGVSRSTEAAFRAVSAAQGVPSGAVDALTEDRDGNLWLGTEDAGLVKLVKGGLVSFGVADGLRERPIASIFEDAAGALYVTAIGVTNRDLHRLDGERFTAVTPRVPPSITYLGWSTKQTSFRGRDGVWWIATGEGLCRYPPGTRFEALATTLPARVYTRTDGLAGDNVFRLYEDRRGDVWIGTIGPGEDGLSVLRRSTDRIESLNRTIGFPEIAPTSFAEDRDGGLWIGLYPGGLVRIANPVSPSAPVERFGADDGLASNHVAQVFVDRNGKLWVATPSGLYVLEELRARPLRVRRLTRANGLATDNVGGIADDARGRLYLATSAGVTRMDPESGSVRHYTTDDGLPRAYVNLAYRDSRGDLWFGTRDGLARLTPETDSVPAAPAALIRAVQVAGSPVPMSILGETTVQGLKLRSGQNRIRIEFGAVGFRVGESVAFQYRLDEDRAYSLPAQDRSIVFDGLPSGRHRLEVRAVTNDGVPGPSAATVRFAVEPPLWRSPWFLAAASLVLGAGLYTWHRARAARAVAIERVRTHIATDLHDDIGATLSQIAILNEVALAGLTGPSQTSRPLLESAARSARELVDTMGDIVWSVDPRRDQVDEIVRRMRRTADELCAARGIALTFTAPENGARALEPATRRQVFLVFKESLNNAVRHSRCQAIRIRLHVEGRTIELTVRDDGCGFDPEAARDGNGLPSLRRRARAIGGELSVRSSPGSGTEVRFTAAL